MLLVRLWPKASFLLPPISAATAEFPSTLHSHRDCHHDPTNDHNDEKGVQMNTLFHGDLLNFGTIVTSEGIQRAKSTTFRECGEQHTIKSEARSDPRQEGDIRVDCGPGLGESATNLICDVPQSRRIESLNAHQGTPISSQQEL